MIGKLLLGTIVVLAVFIAVSAQENSAELQRGEVKKLESMVGQWKGAGWIQQGAKRETFTGTESVQRKIDGLALLVEGARKDPANDTERRAIILAARPLWMRLFDRYVDGPAVGGRITDAAGQPVLATISIDELKTAEGETWTSRCRDGRYDRYLPAPGNYTVRIKVADQPDVTRSIEVTAGRTQLDVAVTAGPGGKKCPPEPK